MIKRPACTVIPWAVGPGLVCLALLCGCYDSPEEGNHDPVTTDECGDIKSALFPIINGVDGPDTSVADLSEAQIASIGGITADVTFGEGHCTATLIAPNVALTAAHCIDSDPFSIFFSIGNDFSEERRDFMFASREWHFHPLYAEGYWEHDVAILILLGDPLAEGLMPIPVNCEPTSLVGETVQLVGYGLTDPDFRNTQRFWTTMSVINEDAGAYQTFSEDSFVCYGDSGSPALYTKADGEIYVMGVASRMEREDCRGYSLYVRTDFSCDFISAYASHEPCWGQTYEGRCSDDRSVRCEDGEVVVEDCGLSGGVCDLNAEGLYRCVAGPDLCEGETYEGRCDGNRAVWCDGVTVHSVPCYTDTVCMDRGDGFFRCVNECDTIGREGRCSEDNTRVRWCEDGVIKERDCALCSQTCGFAGDPLGYYCL
jgi:V8-like Glu-specific endopeptidase